MTNEPKKNLRQQMKEVYKVPGWTVLLLIVGMGMYGYGAALASHAMNPNEPQSNGFLGLGIGLLLTIGAVIVIARNNRVQNLQKDENAVSPVIGVILMVAITVVLAAVVFLMVQHLASSTPHETPQVTFTSSGASAYMVSSAPSALPWSDFTVQGCTTFPATGNVAAGDKISGCSGTVVVSYKPTNSVVWTNG